jgi:Leucine-rich repeat (LRR) protein
MNVFGLFEAIAAREVRCETIRSGDWGPDAGSPNTCWMHGTTVIDQKNMRIANRDGAVRGLGLWINKKIHYLPIGVKEAFPHLEFISAGQCAVREISKENFAGLSSLKALWLEQNRIEKIDTNTFEDLVSLEHLWLCKKI